MAASKLGKTIPEFHSNNPTPNADAPGVSPVERLTASGDRELQEAFAAARDNNLPLAESLLRRVLQTRPGEVNALKLLAEIAWNKRDYNAAETLYGKCVEFAPDFTAARYRYTELLVELSKLGTAKTQLDELLRRDPGNSSYKGMMAYIMGQLGDYTNALSYHREVLKEFAEQPRAWMVYANDLRAAGAQSDCIAAYRKSIELEPACADAYWNLSNLKTFRFLQAEVDAMRDQLARSDLTLRNRSLLHFTLGKAHEDDGEYEKAFDNYKRGNALHRSSIDYDADRTTSEFERLKSVFTRDFFVRRAGSGCAADAAIFIVGLPRSGSTLVEQILSSHSAIEGTRELPHVQAIAGRLGMFPDSLHSVSADAYGLMGEAYLEETRIFRRLGRPYFTDKMPSNFAYVGLIQLMMPNAKIIDVRRHPLDCCVANFKQIFSRAFRFSYSLGDVGRYYRDYVDLMAHFDGVLPGRIHRINYERLVARPETEIRRLLDYLGLPFERPCLQFYENDRPVRTASSEQVRMPIFTDSIESWRKYEFALSPLKTALGSALQHYPAVTS
jgi:tetratricopeptide (TPR) repeat protein